MYCSKCGTELPEEANFCLKCGKPQKADVVSVEPRNETCEIVWALSSGLVFRKSYFWAKAIGSKGIYNAGNSNIFLTSGSGPDLAFKDVSAAHTMLVNKLVADGWEPTGDRGEEWYTLRFRRLVKE